ncbi:MAG: putative bifunctional diguanylate cyclase/phosphodiesterase, partial [Pontibacterium sp.]
FSTILTLTDEETGQLINDPLQEAVHVNNNKKTSNESAQTNVLTNLKGEAFSIKHSICPIIDSDGSMFGAIMVFQDISESVAANKRMSYLAQHDALTELPNRVLLMDRLERACSKYEYYQHEFSLIFIDLDNFKTINDTLGHDQGDLLLQTVAQRLVKHCRDTDTVCRLGGDEFVLLLDAMSNPHVLTRFAEKVISEIGRPIVLCDTEYRVTASMGIAIAPRDGTKPDTLMRHADTAMYKAKAQGRNSFFFYSNEMEAEVERRLLLEQMLRQGIEKQEFKLAYQPIVDTQTESLIYVEALCRWNHQGQDIKPSEFISVAEDSRLIRDIGLDLIKLACQALNAHQQGHDEDLVIAVNISEIQLLTAGFADQVAEIFKAEGVSPHNFVFEVTESSVTSNLELCLNTLHQLKALGIRLSLDDFGTGHASLSHLKRFPIDILKIDREFIKDLELDAQNKIFVNGILQLAHALNLTVVAEGVENLAQANLLREMGCDHFQGDYFAQPMPLNQLLSPDAAKNHIASYTPQERLVLD